MIEPHLPECQMCSGSGIAAQARRYKTRLPMMPGYSTVFVPCSCPSGRQVAAKRTTTYGAGGVFR